MLQPFEPILAIDRSYSTCFRSLKVSNDIGCLIRVLNLLLSFSSLSGSKAAAEFFFPLTKINGLEISSVLV